MKKFIKKNSLTIVAILLTLIVIKGGVDAATSIAGSNVTYKDNYSLGATTVQAAVDSLCSKVSNIDTRLNNIGLIDGDVINTTVPSGGNTTNIGSITLPANGQYIVLATHEWSTSFDGVYVDCLGSRTYRGNGSAGGGITSYLPVKTTSSEQTIYYKSYQASGSSRTITSMSLYAIRIK